MMRYILSMHTTTFILAANLATALCAREGERSATIDHFRHHMDFRPAPSHSAMSFSSWMPIHSATLTEAADGSWDRGPAWWCLTKVSAKTCQPAPSRKVSMRTYSTSVGLWEEWAYRVRK